MTLIVTEVYGPVSLDLRECMVIFVADQRITLPGNFPPKFMSKIFRIQHLNAGIGYYGLAELRPNLYFASWLPNFINKSSSTTTLREFAYSLCDELNRQVNKEWLTIQHSGFHICGFNDQRLPELWHLCNHGMVGNTYIDFAPEYHPSEDFLRRDAPLYGFDGTRPVVTKQFLHSYVNGDVRSFHATWYQLNGFLREMFSYDDFKHPVQTQDFEEIARWKMRVISSFYQRFAHKPLIGGNIDAFALLPEAEGPSAG